LPWQIKQLKQSKINFVIACFTTLMREEMVQEDEAALSMK
jgi:hypothetical protein